MSTGIAGNDTWKWNAQGLKDNDVVGEGDKDAEGESFHECECCEEHKVERVAVAFPVEKTKIDERSDEGNI